MLEKLNRMNELYDLYQALLTAKQKLYFELYYQEDLSLSEIADQFNISRNGVFDHIKRTEKALENYEEKLKLLANRGAREALLEQLKEDTEDKHLQHLIEQLQSLE